MSAASTRPTAASLKRSHDGAHWSTLHAEREDDQLGRDDVWWETLVFRLLDDGTGGLPLLRHIIVN